MFKQFFYLMIGTTDGTSVDLVVVTTAATTSTSVLSSAATC